MVKTRERRPAAGDQRSDTPSTEACAPAIPLSDWIPYAGGEGMLLLARDLLDQQIIDVHGRKVVRVNDVDIHEETGHGHVVLKVGAVDVGARGAVRRLLKGVVPAAALHRAAGENSAADDSLGVC